MPPSAVRLCFCLLFVTAAPASAQVVRGTVTDATTLAPVAGAFVSLVDVANGMHFGVLADARGDFVLRAPAEGTYTLRIERIGYETEETAPFAVVAAFPTTLAVALDSRAIELEALRAEGENRCRIEPELGARTAAVWAEIRKALRLANWTAQQSGRTFRSVLHARTYEPTELHVLHEEFHSLETTGARPFTTPPPAELAELGYIREYPDSIVFYAPDADILLSDEFADGHCFTLRRDDGRLGLRFEPVEQRRLSDVRGTLWIDARTLALEELNFEYDRLPYEGHDSIGGRIHFATLEDGAIIVQEWRIRSPVWVGFARRVRTFQLREHGGRVIDAFDRDVRADASETAVLAGVVYDSVHHRPLHNAAVAVAGVRRSTRTDTAGRFELTGLPPGTYMIEIDHPDLDRLPRVFPPPIVTLEPDDTVDVLAATPSLASMHAALCRVHLMPRELRSNHGIIWGYARDDAYHPLAGRNVNVQWTSAMGGGARRNVQGSASTVTTPSGRYVACGVPDGARGAVLLHLDARTTERMVVSLGGGGIARVDFVLPAEPIEEPQP